MSCALTIIEAHGATLAKRWQPDGTCRAYDNARLVTLHPEPVADLAALAALLKQLAPMSRRCIVRGEPIDPARVVRVRRLLHSDPETCEPATLREVPRRWASVDVDSLPVPSGTDLHDLAACARVVVAHLPHAFRDVAGIVTATAGHGIKPGVRLRLWYWLSRPTTGAELRRWFEGCPVDIATFHTVQPNYTAAPIFAGSMPDPLPLRLAMIPGAHGVARVPAPSLLRPVRIIRAAPAGSAGHPSERFAGLLRTVRNAPEGSRHQTLFWAACRAGELVAAGGMGEGAAAAALARAAMDGGGKDERNAEATARGGIARGKGDAA